MLAHAQIVSGEPFPSREPYDGPFVEQYADYRSVDVDVAERLLRFQDAAVEALGTFEGTLGRDFAGMWVNEQFLGDVAVGVLHTTALDDDEIRSLFERPDMVRVVRQARSLPELRQVLSDLTDAHEWLGAHTIHSWYVDEPSNLVYIEVVDAERASAAMTEAFPNERFGIVERDPPSDDQSPPPVMTNCHFSLRSGCNPLRGGTNAHLPSSGVNTGCTWAYTAYDKVYTHVKFILTAAHCSGNHYHAGAQIGSRSFQQNSGPVDAVRFQITQPGWQWRPWVYRLTGSQDHRIYSVHRSGDLPNGIDVSMSGRESGFVIGTITNNNHAFTQGSTSYWNFVRASYCRGGGDSGAPVFISHQGVGIHKGGYGSCDAIFGYAWRAEQALQVWIDIAPFP